MLLLALALYSVALLTSLMVCRLTSNTTDRIGHSPSLQRCLYNYGRPKSENARTETGASLLCGTTD